MQAMAHLDPSPHPSQHADGGQGVPFAQQWEAISKQELIELRAQAAYWQAQHDRAKVQIEALKQELAHKDATIKDLKQRLFGKKSEKHSPLPSEKAKDKDKTEGESKRPRGQQPGSPA